MYIVLGHCFPQRIARWHVIDLDANMQAPTEARVKGLYLAWLEDNESKHFSRLRYRLWSASAHSSINALHAGKTSH